MTMRADAVLARFPGLEAAELTLWVERAWIRPECSDTGELSFLDIDVARVGLVYDLRHRLDMSEDAMPVVLSLVDQIHDLRGQLEAVRTALSAQPAEVMETLCATLRNAARR